MQKILVKIKVVDKYFVDVSMLHWRERSLLVSCVKRSCKQVVVRVSSKNRNYLYFQVAPSFERSVAPWLWEQLKVRTMSTEVGSSFNPHL